MFDLYENIKRLCARRDMSVSAMCEACGLSKSTLSNLRNGRSSSISRKTAEKIAVCLGVTADEVLYGVRPDDDEGLWEYLQLLKDKPGLRVILDHTKNATPEDIDALARVLGIGGNDD